MGSLFPPNLLGLTEELEDISIPEADLSLAERAGFEQYLLQQRPHLLKQYLHRQPFSRSLRQDPR